MGATRGDGGSEAHRRRFRDVLRKALQRALRGGVPGAAAMVLNVGLLMWLRTTMNYQFGKGGTFSEAVHALYRDGGVLRFYRGWPFALVSGPLSRFGDTAANEGMIAFLEGARGLSIGTKTLLASIVASLWRVFITPMDTVKTVLQVHGAKGLDILGAKVQAEGPLALYDGALGSVLATLLSHYPWYVTHNFLQGYLPKSSGQGSVHVHLRNALIGFLCSLVADCVSNSARVVKTVKQTAPVQLSYLQALQAVVQKDGAAGLFLRGLSTKLLANAVSSVLFTVLWRHFMELMNRAERSPPGEGTGDGLGGNESRGASGAPETRPDRGEVTNAATSSAAADLGLVHRGKSRRTNRR